VFFFPSTPHPFILWFYLTLWPCILVYANWRKAEEQENQNKSAALFFPFELHTAPHSSSLSPLSLSFTQTLHVTLQRSSRALKKKTGLIWEQSNFQCGHKKQKNVKEII